ncbi:DUF7529 family protein [Halopenitus persicus]|uniref:Uncharacterized protein n=1 Tax=Halopenitus persicus TaxID=1048396 RepID=A0A1H3HDC6_9EURY|nr:hypothetical protein [Halopenitus persicus]SDY13225.1 hypothetical protein SAMN05216564_103222 [Halopenitus persicus]
MDETDPDDAWDATLADRDAMAEGYRERGWDVVTVTASATGIIERPPVGITYILPGEEATAIEEVGTDTITDSSVYAATADETLYLVTELRATDEERMILLAGAIPLADLEEIADDARDAGEFRTRFIGDDGAAAGAFIHENPDPFLTPLSAGDE